MYYQEFEELLENSDPNATIVFEDGSYVVGGHKEFDDKVRIFRNDDLGFDVGCPLIPNREIAEEHSKEPDWVDSLYRTLTAQCRWRMSYASVVVTLPGQMFFHNVNYVETLSDGTIVLSVGDVRY